MKTCLVFVLFYLGLSTLAMALWDLNDVSYLMPLPKIIGPDNLLRMKDEGRHGLLLPRQTLSVVPPLSPVMTSAEAEENLRVIAVRIDPCFPLPTPLACQKQIRLVWQPLEVGFRQQTSTVDAALHSFYVLTDAEFDELLSDLITWKNKFSPQNNKLPLQIHPAWKNADDQSPALIEFNSLVKKYAGFTKLTRVTSMVVRGAGDMWAFAGFEFKDNRLKLFMVPRLERQSQAFVNFAVPADHFERGMISPQPTGDDAFSKITTNSDRYQVGETTPEHEEDILKELRAMHRIENPHTFNPENMDCVSCHVALSARAWIEKNRFDLSLQPLADTFAYKNAHYNLENKSTNIHNTQSLRAFGYFGNDLAISQRVINESAAVADQINRYVESLK